MFQTLNAYVELLIEQPGLAELALQVIPIGTPAFPSTLAAWGMDMLLLYVSSVAFEQAARSKYGDEQMAVIEQSYQAVDAIRFPLIHSRATFYFSLQEHYFRKKEVFL
ncbi:hypothetical protein [Brevibacillus nitrificans]|uniref:hypothetical protein n=1 Tax=Brevibacillus nitrificans TaxID=651560 RepID=UPI0028571B30|nr:hypothetical protein [Brevibacillus nitrificans]MDR7316870.1 hypothetical protein [Brevibacillus nitrificans]